MIDVAICASAFLYNKPSDAAFGGSERGIIALDSNKWFQFDAGKQRDCKFEVQYADVHPSGIICLPWKTK